MTLYETDWSPGTYRRGGGDYYQGPMMMNILSRLDRDDERCLFNDGVPSKPSLTCILTIINIYRWLEGIVEKRVPKKRVRRGKKVKPWRDEELRSLLRERRQAERFWRKYGTDESKRTFNDLKKKFGLMDKEKRALFIKEDLETVKDDPRALQRKLQRLLGKTETILPETTNSKNLADSFSQFFNSKVTKIRKFVEEEQRKYEESEEPEEQKVEESEEHRKYEETEEQKYEDSEEPEEQKSEESGEHEYEETGPEDCQPSWTDFAIVYEEEIVSVIKSMSNKHCDLDPLPTSVVKECPPSLCGISGLRLQYSRDVTKFRVDHIAVTCKVATVLRILQPEVEESFNLFLSTHWCHPFYFISTFITWYLILSFFSCVVRVKHYIFLGYTALIILQSSVNYIALVLWNMGGLQYVTVFGYMAIATSEWFRDFSLLPFCLEQ
eukprot:sb/3464797/